MSDVITLRDVCVRFGKREALSNVSLRFRGGVLVVMGPNGAGKTTLLNVLSGLIVPHYGECRLLGIDCRLLPKLGATPPYVRESLPPSRMRVSELVEYVSTFKDLDADLMRENLRVLGLDPSIAWLKGLNTLSAGERIKVYVSLALSIRSELYLLDEPNRNLDQGSRGRLRRLIEELVKRGSSFVITTHVYEYVDDLATDVLILKEGKVIFSGPAKGGEASGLCVAWFDEGSRDAVTRLLSSLGLSVVSLGTGKVVFKCDRDSAARLLGVKGVSRVEVGGLRALYASVVGADEL